MKMEQIGSYGIERRVIAQALRQIRIGDKPLAGADSGGFANVEQLLRAFLGQLFVGDISASDFLPDHGAEVIGGPAFATAHKDEAALAELARQVAKSHMRVRVPHIV